MPPPPPTKREPGGSGPSNTQCLEEILAGISAAEKAKLILRPHYPQEKVPAQET